MNLKAIKLFLRIQALGAIGKAGLELGLSPAAATQLIKELEKDLAVKLLNRTTRRVSLTNEGQLFLQHARKIIDGIEEAHLALSGSASSMKGEIRVGASASFGRRYVTPYIPEFLHQYPDVSIKLDLDDTLVDLVESGHDLTFRIGAQASSSLLCKRMLDCPRVLVASPDYLTRHPGPTQPADLIRHNCICLNGNRVWKLKRRTGEVVDIKVSGNLDTNYGEAVTLAAAGGIGVALKSVWDILEHLEQGSLQVIMPDFTAVSGGTVWVVRPPGRVVTQRIRLFTEFMQNKFVQLAEKIHRVSFAS